MKPLIAPRGSSSKPFIYATSNYYNRLRESSIEWIRDDLNYYNNLLKDGRHTYVRFLLEQGDDWKRFLEHGLWLAKFVMLEDFLDWNVFSSKIIEDFIAAANQNDNYELEVILIKYLHSRYGAPEPIENRFEL